MANSKRIYTNDGGQMFIPMNVDGGGGNASFWNTGKTMMSIALGVVDFFAFTWASSAGLSWASVIIFVIVLAIVNIQLIRKFIIEEKYYLKMYEKQKQFEIAEPSLFWNVNIQNKYVLYYLDGKTGIIVKMERDTIVGKDEEFKEKHYDAWSEFYKELNLHKLKRVQMNLMDTAGDDPRFKELDKLIVGAKFNSNLKELVEKQIGHIKAKARNTLFEDDYFLIYSDNYVQSEELIQSVHECVGKLLKGAFVGYKLLDKTALNELFKSEFDIKYFNEDSASISLYGNVTKSIVAFNIKKVTILGEEHEVSNMQAKALKELTKAIRLGKKEYGEISTISLITSRQLDNSSKVDLGLKQEVQTNEPEEEVNLDDILYDDSDFAEPEEQEPVKPKQEVKKEEQKPVKPKREVKKEEQEPVKPKQSLTKEKKTSEQPKQPIEKADSQKSYNKLNTIDKGLIGDKQEEVLFDDNMLEDDDDDNELIDF
jgi:hypothetical protein